MERYMKGMDWTPYRNRELGRVCYNVRQKRGQRGIMCGRYYVNEDTVREIEKIIRRADQKLRQEAGDSAAFQVGDIYKTSVCPLAKVMRHELKKRGVKKLKVVFSTEQPVKPIDNADGGRITDCMCPPGEEHKCAKRRAVPGSVAFVPSVAGLILAGEVVRDLTGI